jgi:OOP family OmpA-OmpF porin
MAFFRSLVLASTVALAACADEPLPPISCYFGARYMVFFDSSQSKLSDSARATVREAAQSVLNDNAARIEITGHTDLVGSHDYNMRLGLQRANAVRAEFASHGVPPERIVVVSRGKTQPLVQTQDQVAEPQNRRVEIRGN